MISTLLPNPVRSSLLQLAVALPIALSAGPAFAHIDVDMGGTHMSRVAGGYNIKDAPCGMAGAPRGANVYKYRPGATINIKVVENIAHPGYFRISFDNDGDDDFVIPSGTSGEHGDCGGNTNCGPGKEDFCSNDTVLLDNLDLHASGRSDPYTWSVTLPNVECANCTLQIIQMMNDFAPFHSPAEYPADDIYYHCIDIELSNDAPESTDTPVENNGMVCKGGSTGAAGAPSAAGAGGSSEGAAGAAGAATAGTGGTAAAAGGSAAAPTAAAGTAASPSAGAGGSKPAAAGGSAAPSTPTASTGSKPASGGAAGKPSTPSTSGSGTSQGSTSSGVGSAGTTSSDSPAPESAEESGGCQAAGGSAGSLFAPAIFGLIALAMRSHRRRRAA